jgi:asparagine synthase (glutamine-hydrolysing)
MCGIVGVFGLGCRVGLTDVALLRMRDTMTHRGPDDSGIWRCPWAVLGHRRLSVIAPGSDGHQPMVSADGRYALVYNGELYNDDEVRRDLSGRWNFRTSCDTETVLAALSVWGTAAIPKLRGMFAFGFVDRDLKRVVLSRDPLGVKPLYLAKVWGSEGPQLVFASEPPAVLAHPDMSIEPDWVTVSAYLTTVRPTLGRRTMFAGLETLEPGETRVYHTDRADDFERLDAWDLAEDSESEPGETREVIGASVAAHLRTDVPICALLSGGLDSAIITHETGLKHERLRTYCAGARTSGFEDDFSHAARLAEVLGVTHTEVVVDSSLFSQRWGEMVLTSGVPMSTPNEVAIYSVAKALRGDGHVVALSGEGADELFGGYGAPMRQASAHVASLEGREDHDGGLFHLRSNAWVGADVKTRVMREGAWERAGRDDALRGAYSVAFETLRSKSPADSPLQAHLRFHRRVNLPNLLRRLDTSTMLASVEGRTPFADIRVARYAEGLAMRDKFVDGDPPGTKLALRRAFAGVLPEAIVARPKASFPLPFEQWMGPMSSVLRTSKFAHGLFNMEAIQTVSAAPDALWNLAWPMINVALWGERWWGAGVPEIKHVAMATA